MFAFTPDQRYLITKLLFLLAALPQVAISGPDACPGGDCQGNQSAGINITAPPSTLNVYNLSGPIHPAPGTSGIRLSSDGGSDLTINSGSSQANVSIETQQAPGIAVSSQGSPPSPQNDPLLNIPIPGNPGVSGGVVQVDSYSNITTGGTNAHGISAKSNTTGYPGSVITALENFSDAGISFKVTSVKKPDGTEGGLDTSVSARIAVVDETGDLPVFTGYAGEAGSFTVSQDGTISFNLGTGFDDLAIGGSRTVSVSYVLDGYRNGVLKRSGVQGELIAHVTRTDSGLDVVKSAFFEDFGDSAKPQSDGKALPDLNSYVAGLVDEAKGAGGAGNSVEVYHRAGTIVTTSATSHGVLAESQGKAGSNGKNGGGFWSFGTKKPTAGGAGNSGGHVTVQVDGNITTEFLPNFIPINPLIPFNPLNPLDQYYKQIEQMNKASIGVFALSSGGGGGRGGNGGTYYYGRRGGTGGDGGLVEVFGNGVINTYGHYTSGILALSEGGNGGNGGDGADVTGGGAGGFGGKGGPVQVEGNWNITTQGNSAHGIWAKSMGGNAGTGGSGGWLAGAPAPGGQATDGGPVTLISGGAITTWGIDSYGLFAQSVGGFGGSGGSGGSIFYSRGGNGNSAGSGGAVSVTNLSGGDVITHGTGAHAVYAQSIGGGGGAGGGGAGIVGVGGSGAAGGFGGVVGVDNAGLIQTYGENARGIYGQSVGGGGGDGGNSAGLVAVGGGGSGTSDGGNVTVTNSGVIETANIGGNAIFAQSIGGGGGSGGSSTGWFSIGGTGGGGGNAGQVVVNNSGTKLQTAAADASAVFAQSVGGGGGKGGNSVAVGAFVSLAIGGSGAAGGKGDDVTVNSLSGQILTSGDRSYGIFAQSIGGGGGDGGFAVSASAGVGGSLSIGVGGAAGGGGDSDLVNVVSHSHIVTKGDDANGIFAESIGGGGGTGGFAISGAASDGVAITFNFGGKGGSGGDGKAVDVRNFGTIETGAVDLTGQLISGNRSIGLQAQSVGGGGGSGGFSIAGSGAGLGAFTLGVGGVGGSGGKAATVYVENQGGIDTKGEDAHGLLAQSVGGGGGNGGFSIAAAGAGTGAATIGVGGAGGHAGDSENVDVINHGAIDTWGNRAVGLYAQSVGGGGGSGGFVITGAGAGTGAATISVGGAGNGGGKAAIVTVNNSGNLHTRGEDAYGMVAQSVGGGGGSGGFSITGSGAGTGAGSFGIGGFGAGGGDGKSVDVTNDGAIDTEGDRAVGLFVQSVGGGGGNGGFSLAGSGAGTGAGTLNLGGFGAGGGSADIVTVDNAGRIVTQGQYAYGLLVQSVGGGGGNGGFSITGSGAGTGSGSVGIGGFAGGGGAGKAVTATNSGKIYTYGAGAAGLFAQSVGGGGGTGGFSIAGSGAKSGSVSFSLGGSGGDGGAADLVSMHNDESVTTYGMRSFGVIAQSVGGGGGAGGFSFSGGVTTEGFTVNASVGGFGGTGGNGGHVDLFNHGGVSTTSGDAHALVAQSIGGGGGSGGFSGSLSASAGSKPNVGISVGGFGGTAGDAGSVDLENDAALFTDGASAYGLFAQSLGGGGGDGGGSLAIALGKHDGAANLAVSVGGFGGAAGKGSLVTVDNTGEITTTGVKAHGIVAQSVGGGGGNGGFSATGVLAKGTNTKDLSVSVGGFGGAGGDAGNVDVTNSSAVHAQGASASGIVAQSLGGGGGNGGFSFAGSFAGTQAKDLAVSVGGSGGAGGKGQNVTVMNTGVIETGLVPPNKVTMLPMGTPGLLALESSDLPPLPEPPLPPELPDQPEALLIERYSTYTAYGIFAQSIGGGGGTGGTSVSVGAGFGGAKDTWNVNSAIAVGGSGGAGNIGGVVSVTNESKVTTRENDSHAIFAQSVGGSGGAGGASFTATIGFGAANEGRSFNGNLSLGGHGGSGNLGGKVDVDNHGVILTYGDISDGIRAQSIGGGGGSGGSARAINYLFKAGSAKLEKDQTAGTNVKTQIVVGGDGGNGNDGGIVHAINDGDIVTMGSLSRGIYAQSIGGGGGSGGDGILGTGTAADDYLLLATLLEDPGGGGNVITKFLKGQLRNLSVAVGGSAGSQGHGNSVKIDNTGNITTNGYGATAILAQSVGGGGGEAQSFASGEDAGGRAVGGAFGKFAIGGAGGAAGNGGEVRVNSNSLINTYGDAAHGIFAQSVGGGGGIAGNVDRALSTSLNIGLGLDFGQSGGGAGNGGAAFVTSAGDIVTRGADAYGILAQSVGGGGGMASSLSTLPDLIMPLIGLAGSVGGHGSGGTVEVTHTGDIVTYGYASHGLFAQSAGGKKLDDAGGISYLGVGGKVTVKLDGNIIVEGVDADGILAQSTGIDGADNIRIDVAGGRVSGGSALGAGVRFLDGAANVLTNNGTIMALSKTAIVGGVGSETVNNFGIVTGNVDLGGGSNAFNNRTGGQFNIGETVALGNGKLLSNAGILSPGGAGALQNTNVIGGLEQSASGKYRVDVDTRSLTADHVAFSNMATLSGEAEISIFRRGRLLPGTYLINILTAAEGVSGVFTTETLPGSALLNYSLAYLPDAVQLKTNVAGFRTIALPPAGNAVAQYLDKISPSATGDLADVLAEIQSLATPSELAAAFTSLSPVSFDGLTRAASVATAAQTTQVFTRLGALRASNQMSGRGAPSFAPVHLAYGGDSQSLASLFDGERKQSGKQGLWLEAFGKKGNQGSDADGYNGFDYRTAGITLGYDREFGENWVFGAALGYSSSDIDFSEAQGDINGRNLTLYGSWNNDGTYAQGMLSYGRNHYDQRRRVIVGSIDRLAASNHGGDVFAASLSGGFMSQSGEWSQGPYAALHYARIDEENFRETGAGGVDMLVGSKNTNSLSAELGLRAVHSVKWRNGDLVTELNAAWNHDFDIDDRVITVAYAGAPGTSFALQGQNAKRNGAIFGAGLSYVDQYGMTASLRYQGEMREKYRAHAILGELRINF